MNDALQYVISVLTKQTPMDTGKFIKALLTIISNLTTIFFPATAQASRSRKASPRFAHKRVSRAELVVALKGLHAAPGKAKIGGLPIWLLPALIALLKQVLLSLK